MRMIKNTKLLLFLLFPFLSLKGEATSDQQEVKTRVYLQQVFAPLHWCVVPWNGGSCCAEIVAIEKEKVVVRVVDTTYSPDAWPYKVFNIEEISPARSKEFDTLDALMEELTSRQVLKSDKIKKGLIAIDRSNFCQTPYFDRAIDIGCTMCISAPHMHVYELELAKKCFPTAKKILDVGSGSGFLTALYTYLAPDAEVYAIDCYEDLVKLSEDNCSKVLSDEAFKRITFLQGDGEKGYPGGGPYDLINVGFMCSKIPLELVKQLNRKGVLIIPIQKWGASSYDKRLIAGRLCVIEKDEHGLVWVKEGFSCSFVPSQSITSEEVLEHLPK
jgi:protein-L-isoaspartate(D-aspartate) O-methyltransferase